MKTVRGRGNRSTEETLVGILRENNVKGWRRHYGVIGHPDFVFVRQRIAIFVDGCFWHGHNCRTLTPKQNGKYWRRKVARNKEREASPSLNGLRPGDGQLCGFGNATCARDVWINSSKFFRTMGWCKAMPRHDATWETSMAIAAS